MPLVTRHATFVEIPLPTANPFLTVYYSDSISIKTITTKPVVKINPCSVIPSAMNAVPSQDYAPLNCRLVKLLEQRYTNQSSHDQTFPDPACPACTAVSPLTHLARRSRQVRVRGLAGNNCGCLCPAGTPESQVRHSPISRLHASNRGR